MSLEEATGRPRVGIVVVTYAAASTVESVLDRIPPLVHGAPPLVLVADDAGPDNSAEIAAKWAEGPRRPPTVVVRHEQNLGLGGNQKFGYRWAAERGLEAVALLHGDGQYPAELIPDLVEPILAGRADAVFGSRMLVKGAARAGGMPLRRYIGNKALSWLQNRLSGAHLSEWYSGFRAYRPEVLAELDEAALPDGFDYDPIVLLHLLDIDARIAEIPIPTHYGDEVSRVRLGRDGLLILWGALRHRRGAGKRRGAPLQRSSPVTREPSELATQDSGLRASHGPQQRQVRRWYLWPTPGAADPCA